MTGKIVRVDLTSGEITEEEIPAQWQQGYIGGAGMNAKILYDALKEHPQAVPLGPENALTFGPGLLAGTAFPCCARMTITAKSPLTGIFGDSNGDGFFPARLRQATTMS